MCSAMPPARLPALLPTLAPRAENTSNQAAIKHQADTQSLGCGFKISSLLSDRGWGRYGCEPQNTLGSHLALLGLALLQHCEHCVMLSTPPLVAKMYPDRSLSACMCQVLDSKELLNPTAEEHPGMVPRAEQRVQLTAKHT